MDANSFPPNVPALGFRALLLTFDGILAGGLLGASGRLVPANRRAVNLRR